MMVTRQPAGTPTGGEFAANAHDEAGSYLAQENETQRRVRDALAPISEMYPRAHSVHLLANTSNPYGYEDYDDGETLAGRVSIDGIYDQSGVCIWDQGQSRRDPRLERIEDSLSDITRYSDLPEDSSVGSGRGNAVGVDLRRE